MTEHRASFLPPLFPRRPDPPSQWPHQSRTAERRIGLDHVAFGTSRDDVLEMTRRLREAGVTFRDPDNIQWEYFQE